MQNTNLYNKLYSGIFYAYINVFLSKYQPKF